MCFAPRSPAAVPATRSHPIPTFQLDQVTARRCDGRVQDVLGSTPTAADPWFFTAENGVTYVVKANGKKANDATTFNEALFGQLARRLELRVPEVVAIDVPADLVADDDRLTKIGYPPGLHVGIGRLPAGTLDLRGDVLAKLGASFLVDNMVELPGTVAFSSWIEDHDHRKNNGNWMIQPTSDKNRYVVWIIDFGHAIRGPDWNQARLTQFGDPATVTKLGPHAVAVAACGVTGCYASAVKSIDDVTKEELEELVNAIPAAWHPGAVDRTALIEFLLSRRPGVARVLGVP